MFSFHCDNLSKQGPHLLGILVLHIGLLFTVQNVQQILVDLPSCGPKSRFYVAIILGRRPAHKQWHRSIKSQQLAWDAFDVTLICFLTADHYIYIDILCTVIAATNLPNKQKGLYWYIDVMRWHQYQWVTDRQTTTVQWALIRLLC